MYLLLLSIFIALYLTFCWVVVGIGNFPWLNGQASQGGFFRAIRSVQAFGIGSRMVDLYSPIGVHIGLVFGFVLARCKSIAITMLLEYEYHLAFFYIVRKITKWG